jgi:hypothetical protein
VALWVRQAVNRLDAPEREILMLPEYEQLSYSEIGELLRLPVNTVRSRLFRSRMALKSYLEPAGKLRVAVPVRLNLRGLAHLCVRGHVAGFDSALAKPCLEVPFEVSGCEPLQPFADPARVGQQDPLSVTVQHVFHFHRTRCRYPGLRRPCRERLLFSSS